MRAGRKKGDAEDGESQTGASRPHPDREYMVPDMVSRPLPAGEGSCRPIGRENTVRDFDFWELFFNDKKSAHSSGQSRPGAAGERIFRKSAMWNCTQWPGQTYY